MPIATHSHSRGTNIFTFVTILFNSDSFQRTWDKLWIQNRRTILIRIIPTRVGQTMDGAWRRSLGPIHSHVRGTNKRSKLSIMYFTDSFPRAWDKRTSNTNEMARKRFIPTHVGQTLLYLIHTKDLAIHPTHVGQAPDIFHTRHLSSSHSHMRGTNSTYSNWKLCFSAIYSGF